MPDDLSALLLTIYSHPLVRWVGALLAANVLLGISTSLYTRSFRLAATGDWLLSRALPYLLGSGAVQLVALAAAGEYRDVVGAIQTATWAFVMAALIGKIVEQLRELGVPLPAALGDLPKPDVTAGT